MICLSGDLHHMTLGTGNQKHSDIPEIQIAEIYLKLLEEAGIKVTFFITGRSFAEEWHDLEPICRSSSVEIGGHNFNAFKPSFGHRVWNKFTGNYNGPYICQKRDAQKTIEIIQQKTGKKIAVWRNHMYMHGPNTEKVLADLGIRICSDGVKKNSNGLIAHPSGIYNFPLNIIPDHEHLIHAERTPQWIEWWQKRYNWSDDFGPDSYYVEEWTDIVLAGLKHNEANGVISNMIIHPITLYLSDKFHSFKDKLLPWLADHKTVFMSELLPMQDK
ncbi:MAG: polysaccharide deacetylase family protein [Candidatus Stygibacter australis]|nr:polysaccharide deacetylase family protein [Candidatus Stygibacter australis]MDP8322732.1 polysaccharide deacetylase family protein [Candidatus Stygibacter australis]